MTSLKAITTAVGNKGRLKIPDDLRVEEGSRKRITRARGEFDARVGARPKAENVQKATN